jgi:alanine racemase
VALLPVGYAVGLGVLPESLARRRHQGWKGCLRRWLRPEQEAPTIGGRPVPLLGRIAMDWCCLDVTDLPEAEVGTEVVLPVRRLMMDSALERVEV